MKKMKKLILTVMMFICTQLVYAQSGELQQKATEFTEKFVDIATIIVGSGAVIFGIIRTIRWMSFKTDDNEREDTKSFILFLAKIVAGIAIIGSINYFVKAFLN